MGGSSFFKEGGQALKLRLYQREKNFLWSVFVGKSSVRWLLKSLIVLSTNRFD